MTKKFLTPIVLPGNPTAAMQAATKQYVDDHVGGQGSLTGRWNFINHSASLLPGCFYSDTNNLDTGVLVLTLNNVDADGADFHGMFANMHAEGTLVFVQRPGATQYSMSYVGTSGGSLEGAYQLSVVIDNYNGSDHFWTDALITFVPAPPPPPVDPNVVTLTTGEWYPIYYEEGRIPPPHQMVCEGGDWSSTNKVLINYTDVSGSDFSTALQSMNNSALLLSVQGWSPYTWVRYKVNGSTSHSGYEELDVTVLGFSGYTFDWLEGLALAQFELPGTPTLVPPGGEPGQVLTQLGDADIPLVQWEDASGGGGGSELPAAGSANRVLKSWGPDVGQWDWANPPAPIGGTTGQVLTKNSNSNSDAGWYNIPPPLRWTGNLTAGATPSQAQVSTSSGGFNNPTYIRFSIYDKNSTDLTALFLSLPIGSLLIGQIEANPGERATYLTTSVPTLTGAYVQVSVTQQSYVGIGATWYESMWFITPSTGRSGTYTPTLTNITIGTGGAPTNTASWAYQNGVLTISGTIQLGTTGFSVGSVPTVSLPPGFTSTNTADLFPLASSAGLVISGIMYLASMVIASSTTIKFTYATVSATYPTSTNVTATLPAAWGANATFKYSAVILGTM